MNIAKLFGIFISIVLSLIGNQVDAEFCERDIAKNCFDGIEPGCCSGLQCCDFEKRLCVVCPFDSIVDILNFNK